MPTSQDLVPTGQPQGARQDTVAAMQAADIPLSSEGGPPAPVVPGSPAGPSPVAQAGPVPRGGLQGFDALANREPTAGFVATPQKEVLFERVRNSPNQVMQSIFSRIPGYKEG